MSSPAYDGQPSQELRLLERNPARCLSCHSSSASLRICSKAELMSVCRPHEGSARFNVELSAMSSPGYDGCPSQESPLVARWNTVNVIQDNMPSTLVHVQAA